MTTLQESICLMDWLREHREIGLGCMAEDGSYNHYPEYCGEEKQDYQEWEHDLRSSSPVAERTYALCRRASQRTWAEKHRDHWSTGEAMTRRVNALTQLTHLREKLRR
jgi:hypothetical protein